MGIIRAILCCISIYRAAADSPDERSAKSIKDYLVFAIISCLFNPLFGIIAIIFSLASRKYRRLDKRGLCILYSDLSFGFSFVGIVSTIVTIVLLYAFKYFPDSAYYDRDELLRSV